MSDVADQVMTYEIALQMRTSMVTNFASKGGNQDTGTEFGRNDGGEEERWDTGEDGFSGDRFGDEVIGDAVSAAMISKVCSSGVKSMCEQIIHNIILLSM